MTATSKSTSLQKVLASRFFVGSSIPTDGSSLAEKLTVALKKLTGSQALPSDAIRATINEAPNIDLLEANLSGLDLDADQRVIDNAKDMVTSDLTDVVDRVPAHIHKVMIKAHPLVVQGVPTDFDMQVEKVPFNWVKDESGDYWFGLSDQQPEEMTGEFSAHITKTALRQAVTQVVAAGAAEKGFKLIALDFDIVQNGQNFLVTGHAKLKKGILSARADGRAALMYDPKKLQLTITRVELNSTNPAVAVLLRMAQGTIDQYQGQVIDLNQKLSPTGQKLSALEIVVSGNDVRLHGKF